MLGWNLGRRYFREGSLHLASLLHLNILVPAGVLNILENKKNKQAKLEKCVSLSNMLYAKRSTISSLLSLAWKRPKPFLDYLKQRHNK